MQCGNDGFAAVLNRRMNVRRQTRFGDGCGCADFFRIAASTEASPSTLQYQCTTLRIVTHSQQHSEKLLPERLIETIHRRVIKRRHRNAIDDM
jgi:hypothetical protein